MCNEGMHQGLSCDWLNQSHHFTGGCHIEAIIKSVKYMEISMNVYYTVD